MLRLSSTPTRGGLSPIRASSFDTALDLAGFTQTSDGWKSPPEDKLEPFIPLMFSAIAVPFLRKRLDIDGWVARLDKFLSSKVDELLSHFPKKGIFKTPSFGVSTIPEVAVIPSTVAHFRLSGIDLTRKPISETGASAYQVLPGEVVGSGKGARYKLLGITYNYNGGKGRDIRYNNPMNIKGTGYEGQTGDDREAMIALSHKNARYASPGAWHAAFSDPYYSIKAATTAKYLCVNWSSESLSADNLKKLGKGTYWPGSRGFKEPLSGRNLYMVCCRYTPMIYDALATSPRGIRSGYNSCAGHCAPLNRALTIVSYYPQAWPNGVDTFYDFSKSYGQFASFIKATLLSEQGVTVEDWYLEACWNAIYNGGLPPTQENLAYYFASGKKPVVTTSTSVSSTPTQSARNVNDTNPLETHNNSHNNYVVAFGWNK